jgi:hypothetical protein
VSIDVANRRPTLMDALTPVLDLLAGAGVRVTLDFTQLNPPGCYLHPPSISWRFNGGDFEATYKLTIVTEATDRTRAVANLSIQLDELVQVLGGLAVSAEPVDVLTADGSFNLPGYDLTWTQRIRSRRTA